MILSTKMFDCSISILFSYTLFVWRFYVLDDFIKCICRQYPYTEDYAYDVQLQIESDKNDDLEKIVPSDSTKRRHHKHR